MRISTFLTISLLAASVLTGSAEIDPGWIVAHGPTYAAQTGDVGYTNEAAIMAWDANRAVMPATFPTGVAVPIPDAEGHYMLIQPQGDGLPVVAIQISDSPIDPQAWKARRDATLARLATERASRSAAYETNKAKAVQSAQGAQNVPALRAAMADMQAQIDALRAIVEAGR